MNLKDPFSQKIFEVYHVINRTPENIYTNLLLAVDNCTLIAQLISGVLHRNRRVQVIDSCHAEDLVLNFPQPFLVRSKIVYIFTDLDYLSISCSILLISTHILLIWDVLALASLVPISKCKYTFIGKSSTSSRIA